MKNFRSFVLVHFCMLTLVSSSLIAITDKKTDRTAEEQESLNAQLSYKAQLNRLKSSLTLIELGGDLDACNDQGISVREMLKKALEQTDIRLEIPMSPTSPNERFYCFAVSKALYREKYEALEREREVRDNLAKRLEQKKHTQGNSKPLFDLTVDTETIKPTVQTTSQRSGPVTPTSPVEYRKQQKAIKRELASLPEAPRG